MVYDDEEIEPSKAQVSPSYLKVISKVMEQKAINGTFYLKLFEKHLKNGMTTCL